MESVLLAMRQALSDCESIVDVGVGTGRFARPLQETGFSVVGIDVSRGMLAKAVERGLKTLIVADAHELPARDEAFDAAIAIHLLHLVRDWRAVTLELGRISRRKVVSMVGRREGPSIRSEYLRLRSQLGYPLARFEDGEEGLRRMVEPYRLLDVKEYWSEKDADDDLSYFEKRGSSMTWDLGEDVHRKIMTELKTKFGGRTLRKRHFLELAVWRPEQLRQL